MYTPGDGDPLTLVFIESNLTGTGMQALQCAKSLGLRVVFVSADVSRYTGSPQGRSTIAATVDEVLACDTLDADAVVAVLGEHGVQPCGVMTVGEYYVPTATRVARRLGLPGLTPEAAVVCRNKHAMRRACAAVDVPVPRFAFVTDLDQLSDALAVVGLPCVVKPTDESASVGVRLCHDRREAGQAIEQLLATPVNSRGQEHPLGALVEQCLFGPEVSVETFTYAGSTTVLGVTDKRLGPTPAFVELGHTFPSMLPASFTAAARKVAIAALEAVGYDFGPAHVEVKLTADGPVLIEINCRTGGDAIPELVELALGVPLLEQSVIAHAGGVPRLTASRDRGAAIRFATGSPGVVRETRGGDLGKHIPGLERVHLAAQVGTTIGETRSSHDRIGYVLASAATPAEAAAVADAAICHVTVSHATA